MEGSPPRGVNPHGRGVAVDFKRNGHFTPPTYSYFSRCAFPLVTFHNTIHLSSSNHLQNFHHVFQGRRSHRQGSQASAGHLQPGHQGQWHGLHIGRHRHEGGRRDGRGRHSGSHGTRVLLQITVVKLGLTVAAPMHQEPPGHPGRGRHQPRQGRQGQRVPFRHERLCQDERGLLHLLGRRQARAHVSHVCLQVKATLTKRRCVAVKTLPRNTDVEIECQALQ